jgi:hypothetical protein
MRYLVNSHVLHRHNHPGHCSILPAAHTSSRRHTAIRRFNLNQGGVAAADLLA